MSTSPFVELFECESPDPERLGGKGAALCRLVSDGYRVPPGCIVPVEAFLHTCRALELSQALDRLAASLVSSQDILSMGAEIESRLRSSRTPDVVLEPILAAIDDLALWQTKADQVIVRSSATVEDGTAHSFAGIFESISVQDPDELEPTIREVWASAFSPRALMYYAQIGLAQLPTMAVIVQRFLAAERSGVMFTTFDDRTLVEHVEGDCEKLVKGEVTPERLWLDATSGRIEGTGSLNAAHARELAGLAETLEARFGGPQDVEWVLWNDEIHVVQSRPITAASVRPAAEPSTGADLNEDPVLRGIPASGGWGSGDVHLAFNIADALAIESGEVLVTPMTNPDMVVAMQRSAAIVTDVGGMICHAAIVSRELGLPCVVGTASATVTLGVGEPITVVGSAGAVYRGRLELDLETAQRRPARWADVWSAWVEAAVERPELVPIVSTIEALEAMPADVDLVVLVPDIDLRTSPTGLWVDLEGMDEDESDGLLEAYFTRLSDLAERKALRRAFVLPGGRAPAGRIREIVERIGLPLAVHDDGDRDAPRIEELGVEPLAAAAVPLGFATLRRPGQVRPEVGGMEDAEAAALDTIKFFGHEPQSSEASMPSVDRRSAWWSLLPEYGRFHQEFATEAERGSFTWLEIRPELVISALLKSLVQPGFEMVPRVMGFRDLPPMHTKWIRCRYHFRSDTFAGVWQAIVPSTWSTEYMADLMRRVRASYDQLEEVLVLFPTTDEELGATSAERIVALITSWWPRWVEFFALCWFIQAQGDDIVYPFVEETVADNLGRMREPPADVAWPGAADLIAPTTPVLSGEYMADVALLRQELHAAGLTTAGEALAALDRSEQPDVAQLLARHLERWHWMRDRDLLFEPWDTAERVIRTALETEPHAQASYEDNLRRNVLALSLHFDLARAAGRADGLIHAARFLHDLNVERENHHVLWLKFSYPVRRLFLEIERRLVVLGSLEAGDIFFMQAPEIIEATRRLPEALSPDLVRTVRNRRRAFFHEARLAQVDPAELVRDDDYY